VTHQLSSTLANADDFLSMLDGDLSLGNPTALLANGSAINKNRVEMTHFNTVIAPRFEFNRNLILTETFSYTLDRISQRYYRPLGGMPTFLIEGIGLVQNMAMSMFSKETSITSDTRLQFAKQLREHYLNAFVGVRYNSFAYDDNQPQGQYSTAGNDKTPNISTNMEFYEADGANDEWRSLTYYANVDYNYRNRYFVQASLAMDGSSRFGKKADGIKIGGVKWGVFPSVQLGWALSNESWFPKTKLVNYVLLRAGWDLSGNDDIDNYAARTSFTVSKYLWKATAAQLNNIGNEEISWEQTRKLNVGLKAYFLNNRLGIDFDYYQHRTTNLLTLKNFNNPVAGITNYWSNGGSLENTGFELAITGKPVVTKNFQVELGASLGHYVNEIKSLPDDNLIYVDGAQTAQGYTSSIYGTDNIATIVGQPLGVFYGYRTNGVFSSDAAARVGIVTAENPEGYLYLKDATGANQYFKAGDVYFQDLNGDGMISEADKTIIGDPNPDVYGNIFANVSWKNLTLSLGFNYSIGNDVFNYQRSILEGGNNFYNQSTTMTNRWRAEGQQTDVPRISYGDPMGNSRFSDRWIEDGSYVRLKTLRLSYKVPVASDWLQGLSVWAEANNLITLTRYLGSDPEFSTNNSVLYQGIDAGNVAMGRAFTLGLKINL
jgi:TonB-linked SusC/RagA family outer membrane protein